MEVHTYCQCGCEVHLCEEIDPPRISNDEALGVLLKSGWSRVILESELLGKRKRRVICSAIPLDPDDPALMDDKEVVTGMAAILKELA